MPFASRDTAALTDDVCAREPIHTPGSIQPHGALLVVRAADATIVQASANASAWFGQAADALLGKRLTEAAPAAAELLAALVEPADEYGPVHLGDITLAGGGSAAMLAHRVDGCVVLEFEPADERSRVFDTIYPLVRSFLSRLQTMPDTSQMCQLAVEETQRITGYGRVMAYCFDRQGHGRVLAEVADAGYERYVGLHFPATDIPRQARELYRRNRIRAIHDADYEPVPLVPRDNPVTGAPTDLSHSVLRSVSPVHVQYMRNMGTMASASISLLVGNTLWGLISCHNAEPRPLSLHIRTACELIGRVLAQQIEAREQHAQVTARFVLRRDIVTMLTAMADRDSVIKGLLTVPQTFMSFLKGSGAAVVTGDRCELFGHSPPRDTVLALCRWLSERGTQDIFHTDNVMRDIPCLPGLAEDCAGLLAIRISSLHSHHMVWFRVEQVQTVNWAGRPDEAASGKALTPRTSFALWQEIVRGFCESWEDIDIEGACELRNAVLGLVLRKAEEKAELAADLAESNRELEAFSYSVSHDLRAPLRHIAGYAELLADTERTQLSERGSRFLDNIGESARFAGTLVDNLLSFSQMGRAALRYSDVSLQALVETIRSEMLPDVEGRSVEWHIHALPVVVADAAFVHLALRNLLSNALKYTRGRDTAIIEVGARRTDDELIVYVRDNGVGFDMKYSGKLFGVFQRLHRMEEFEGTGIGLASVRRIIERHDGRVWAEGEPDNGATFYFSLPHHGHTR